MPNLPALITALHSPDPAQRVRAAEELSHLGAQAREVAVPLVHAVADESEEVREWAVAALEELGPPPAGAVDDLAALVSHQSADVAYWSATLLGRAKAESAVPALVAALGSSAPHVRQRAAWALGEIGSPKALDWLKKAATDPDPRLARLARTAIESIEGNH